MKREILFRGKRIDNGEWVKGGFFREPYTDKAFIVCWNSFGLGFIEEIEVDPETVGQYTGLTDKNGKRIFEGDIVMFLDYTEPAFVVWDQEDARWYMRYSDCMLDFSYRCVPSAIEVIGNIHDNPELIAEVESDA